MNKQIIFKYLIISILFLLALISIFLPISVIVKIIILLFFAAVIILSWFYPLTITTTYQDRIEELLKSTQNIASSDNFSEKITLPGEDNISSLANTINILIDNFKNSTRNLALNEQMNRAIIENSPLGISVRDKTGQLLYYNKKWKNIWRMEDEDILEDQRKRETFSFDKRDLYLTGLKSDVKKIYTEGGSLYLPEVFVPETRRTKESIWVSQHFYSITDEKGEVDRVVILTNEITENKLKEIEDQRQKLYEEKKQDVLFRLIKTKFSEVDHYYELILQSICQTCDVDKAGLWFFSNDYQKLEPKMIYCQTTVNSSKSVIFSADDYPDYFREIMDNRLLYNFANHLEEKRQNSLKTYFDLTEVKTKLDISLRVHDKIIGVLSIESNKPDQLWTHHDHNFFHSIGDIILLAYQTEQRKQTQLKLEESEQKYRNLVDAALVGVYITNLDGDFVFVNKAMVNILEYNNSGQLMDINVSDIYANPEDRIPFIEHLTKYSKIENYELDLTTMNGKTKKVMINAYLEGKNIKGMMLDITDWKKAELNLISEKERLAVTLRSIGDGVIVTDTEGSIVMQNSKAEELTGWSEKESIGLPVSEVFHIFDSQSREPVDNPVLKAVSTGNLYTLPSTTLLISRNNQERIITDSAAPIKDKQGNIIGVVLVFRDITEKRKLDQELYKLDKMDSIGLLAGGIAHDFNNLLAGILNNVSLAKISSDKNKIVTEYLTNAEQGIMRAKDLTSQLLIFSKGGTPVKEITSIKNIITETASFILSGSNSICEFDIPDQISAVEVDPGQISQVINNLVLNADQAMPDGGKINISAENVRINQSSLPLKPGNYVKISVIDEGVGIHQKHLNRLFDPFYTTKQKGSGLGLAISFKIIKNHNGHLSVYSEPGKGSVFQIYIPAAKKAEQAKAKKHSLVFGKGRILLMDDDEMIRKSVGKMLKYLGYEVDGAKEGKQAVELYQKSIDEKNIYDLVILDITIPGGMGGKKTMEEIMKIHPEAKGIVSSGYSDDPTIANFNDYGFISRIEKPYRLETLSKVVGESLNPNKT